jgi:hypothetical protein
MAAAAIDVNGRLRHFQRDHQIAIGLAVRDENAQGDAGYLSIRALNRSPKQLAACGSIGTKGYPLGKSSESIDEITEIVGAPAGTVKTRAFARGPHGQGLQIGRGCSALTPLPRAS